MGLDGSITTLESTEERNNWELSLSKTLSSCHGKKSTLDCCDSDAHSELGIKCRSEFHCPMNPCSEGNTCDRNAECVLTSFPPDYNCICPDGHLGNGHKCRPGENPNPKMTTDGTPTEETLLKIDSICGCTVPTIDLCASITCGKHERCKIDGKSQPQCVCSEGYIQHPEHGCI